MAAVAGNDKAHSHTSSIDKKASLEDASLGSKSPEGVYNPVLDKRVWRKLDWLVLPTVAMFYLLSFLVCSRPDYFDRQCILNVS
jgi:hypothetical protein